MNSKDHENAASSDAEPGTEKDELSEQIDEIEEAIIAERDEAGVPGRVSERESVQQTEPDDQAPE